MHISTHRPSIACQHRASLNPVHRSCAAAAAAAAAPAAGGQATWCRTVARGASSINQYSGGRTGMAIKAAELSLPSVRAVAASSRCWTNSRRDGPAGDNLCEQQSATSRNSSHASSSPLPHPLLTRPGTTSSPPCHCPSLSRAEQQQQQQPSSPPASQLLLAPLVCPWWLVDTSCPLTSSHLPSLVRNIPFRPQSPPCPHHSFLHRLPALRHGSCPPRLVDPHPSPAPSSSNSSRRRTTPPTMTTSAPQTPGYNLDHYVVIHVATTCDEHGVYVTKDSAEVIELGWILLDAKSFEEVHRESVLVKPVNTPITALCTSLTTLTWDQVRNAGTFREAVNRFDAFAQEHLVLKNLEFAFVTLDSWDLRVQLPREARDKAVVLPPYLQHSRTFDLRTEYQRWQAHHPESLPFGSSSLANICAALEVEPVQSSAPIKHNLPFHLQSLAPASPRRAMEEAVTLARVLRGLIRKSQPSSEHADILTKPMDARADVRAFLAERSKVLHMSGLPHDTTQSELESWFTQFGGRPISFFTLRTPDQHKPTGTGFVLFSSHEEAAESLCMNGRALNEKAIEVSPSSARVLDRAHDILTPFPPSKNRPRPGDWNCPSCGFSNFQRRTACFRCSFPAVPQGPPGDPMAYGYGAYGGGHPAMMGPPPHHMGHGHGNMGHAPRGNNGGIVPFRAGDWKCGENGCGYHNFAKNVSCLRCGASRAGAAVVADSAFPSPMDAPSSFGMGPPSMGGTPGPGPFGGAPFGAAGGYPAQQLGGPPSSYAFPTGMGAANPYGPMGAQYAPNGNMHGTSFDSRSAEAAFTAADQYPPNQGAINGDSRNDPFSFLSSGFGGLSMNDDRRNVSNSANKSPA
ncbi:hypothetical protein P154DRAFT_536582 [Amniculicola lignicola CBS 123094]|uniref:Uncharacterized protein n=1 Tax=Amniculicola lignicola CBS 123094 TaxID=1392246 RepID=A0A6A5WBJ9_9PLEO|nr:hypothetical protein P154DRAFT_536582 [Amniculicola lignicola CBS 123094]